MVNQAFSRSELLLGASGLKKLQDSFVVLAGVGAVGSFAFEALVRAGIGHIRIIDFDVIEESNLNRQLLAMNNTIGKAKVDVAKNRAENINPNVKIEAIKQFISTENIDNILADNPDLVIDAIDTISSKITLLQSSVQKGLPTFSSMGAALRYNSNMIKIAPLSKSKICPLAAAVRSTLRKEGTDLNKITCVYSEEVVQVIPSEKNKAGKSILGSLPTIPAMFGLILANEAIQNLSSCKDGFADFKSH